MNSVIVSVVGGLCEAFPSSSLLFCCSSAFSLSWFFYVLKQIGGVATYITVCVVFSWQLQNSSTRCSSFVLPSLACMCQSGAGSQGAHMFVVWVHTTQRQQWRSKECMHVVSVVSIFWDGSCSAPDLQHRLHLRFCLTGFNNHNKWVVTLELYSSCTNGT